ncbi:lytic transglycosylase domain-containing protein [Aestuariibacter sp. AA17]|uniref:Lytic transglycosylase domain-containing protein n=1 Tax=Fluctibacter corallii TaxID=2984329 RepID=A0ABT3A4S1_9ALTE|nr:lytic transglycosylase domain-containing protein [Aestuariibacter sp. AA17]MCV2883686.1 lytic transglycosylase domain-containing protein [Aestuariibacter sp. AA17]
MQASPASDDEQALQHQRKMFVKAESFATKPKSWDYKYLMKQIQDYPLKPYIELKTLMAYPYLSNKKKIETFLTQYENTPLDKPLRKKWLRYLARKNQPALFLHFYRDIGDASLTCQRLSFMLDRNTLKEEAYDEIQQLWLVGKSQPKECDPVFKAWKGAGKQTPELVWKRLSLAADGGKHTLIPYLKTLLPSNEQYLADLWLKVRRSPSQVSRTSNFPGKYPDKEAEIIAYGLSRLVWRDHSLALKSYHTLSKRFDFSQTQMARIASKFALALTIDTHPSATQWLEKANMLMKDEELLRWHLAHVVREQDWQQALGIIDSAPDDIADDLSFQYWHARALEETQQPQRASIQYDKLADQRHYYGFMASGKLAKNPSLADKPLVFEKDALLEVATLPGARRAYEFLKLKRFTSARREWIYLRKSLTEPQKLIAAVLADSWGWHDQAIFTLANAGYMDDVKRRFPLAYSEYLVENAKQNNIDPAWAFAIARRESSFMTDAYSGAGARGLMQLMPGTARYLAKKKVSNRTLYDPEKNTQFGTQYLRYLMDKMDNNPVLATASYNAGWRRVKSWLPKDNAVPMDIWVETIPYKETRNYVKAVLAYKQIYANQLGQNNNMFKSLATMQISPSQL